jgi:predicted dehydrogenase
MYILQKGKWNGGYLDYAIFADSVRINVIEWICISKVEPQYIEPKRSFRMIWNYISKIGIKRTLIKIISRLQEQVRNEKYCSLGIGIVLSTDSKRFNVGETVMFMANNHPALVDRIVVQENFVYKAISSIKSHSSAIRYYNLLEVENEFYEILKPWSRLNSFSGNTFFDPVTLCNNMFNIYEKVRYGNFNCEYYKKMFLPIRTKSNFKLPNYTYKKNVIVSGYGQYTKTMILPVVEKYAAIVGIYEYDPTQIPLSKLKTYLFYTELIPRDTNRVDLFIIASYHHFHIQQAIEFFKNNSNGYVHIEKPVATQKEDLHLFQEYLLKNPGKQFFIGFQKRYCPFNSYLNEDLSLYDQQPFSYYCTIYEIKIPREHWYNWPNSGSRIISNGCHWIDHFLFLNNYCSVKWKKAHSLPNGDITIELLLENGSNFQMNLTQQGSSRLGVRENIEIRKGEITIQIHDKNYQSENSTLILRKITKSSLAAHNNMYKEVMKKVNQGLNADTLISLYSSFVVLDLDELINEKISANKKL